MGSRSTRAAALAAALTLPAVACAAGPREGTYDQVVSAGSPMARSGYKSTLVIESKHRFRYQMPMMSVAGEYRLAGDSIYFETGSEDVRVVALRGRVARDTLVLEQPQMAVVSGVIGQDLATQRFVRRR